MADNTNKEFAAIEASRELSKGLKDLIAKYESELSDLQARELKKNSAQLIPQGDAGANLSLAEMEAGKRIKTGASVVKQVAKGETFIDKKNETDGVNGGEQGKRLKDVGLETPNIPKPKKVTPKNHAEGGNDGSNIQAGKSLNKTNVPMAKPPSGGTGLAPKAPAMAKPAAGSMPKPPMMAKAGARMDNPKVEQGKPALNTIIAKAALPGSRPGTPRGDAASDAHKAGQAVPGTQPAPARKPPVIPGRAAALASFTPAGQFTPAGNNLSFAQGNTGRMYQGTPEARKITLPGRGKPTVSNVNPAAAHLITPPPAVRPPVVQPAAPAQAPAQQPQKPSSLATAIKSGHPIFGKSESEACLLCGKAEHPGNC